MDRLGIRVNPSTDRYRSIAARPDGPLVWRQDRQFRKKIERRTWDFFHFGNRTPQLRARMTSAG